MRALLLAAAVLGGCASRGGLYAEPLASLDGGEILPIALRVEAVEPDRAREAFGLDPAPHGVAVIAVQVTNRAFAPMTLPAGDGWALHDPEARAPIARGLTPAGAAARVVAAIREAGGEVPEEAARDFAARLAHRALGAGELPPGGTAAGLVYLLPEGDVRLDAEGLTSRFVAVAIGPVGAAGPARPVAGRLRPR